MDGIGLIYDIDNSKFIGLVNNCLDLKYSRTICYFDNYWKIYKNFLIIVRNEREHYKLYIVDLDKSPFLNKIVYEIQLTEVGKYKCKF